jgi:3-oxoadipate enol-lactonase
MRKPPMIWNRVKNNPGPHITYHPGLGEDHTIFNELRKELEEEDYSSVIFDPEGTGKSPVRQYTTRVQYHSYKSNEVLEQHDIKKTHLIGFSLGGAVSLEYALNKPEVVDKICLINPAFYQDKYFTPLFHVIKNILFLCRPFVEMDRQPRYRRRENIDKERIDLSIYKNKYLNILNSLRVTSFAGMGSSGEGYLDYEPERSISEIKSEVLLIRGTKDEFFKKGLVEQLHEELPNSRIELIKGGHLVHLTKEERVKGLISEFLSP